MTLPRGFYSAPMRKILDRRGQTLRYECAACGRRVTVTTRQCGCGVQLLGREVKVGTK